MRPAAVAFAGTSLALVPEMGLALYNLGLHHGPAAWLISFLIRTAARDARPSASRAGCCVRQLIVLHAFVVPGRRRATPQNHAGRNRLSSTRQCGTAVP